MDRDTAQTNESHACSDGPDATIGVIIPKSEAIDKPRAKVEETGGDNNKVMGGEKIDTEISNSVFESCDSNNQNATSALEEEGPFCETVNAVLREFEEDFIPPDGSRVSAQSTNSSGQDVEPNTNESNNTNASSCEVLSPDFEDLNPIEEQSGDAPDPDEETTSSIGSLRINRRRSKRRRTSPAIQKNASAAVPRRKRSASRGVKNNNSAIRLRSSSRKSSKSLNKRRRSRN